MKHQNGFILAVDNDAGKSIDPKYLKSKQLSQQISISDERLAELKTKIKVLEVSKGRFFLICEKKSFPKNMASGVNLGQRTTKVRELFKQDLEIVANVSIIHHHYLNPAQLFYDPLNIAYAQVPREYEDCIDYISVDYDKEVTSEEEESLYYYGYIKTVLTLYRKVKSTLL